MDSRFHGRAALGAALIVAIATGSLALSSRVQTQSGSGMGWGRDYWMPGWMHRRHWDASGMNQDMRARMQRHWTYMHEGLPTEYAGAYQRFHYR
ncbi:MAG: hypothetical protein R3D67_20765 [Hyphomicrobiaceae bacterium]